MGTDSQFTPFTLELFKTIVITKAIQKHLSASLNKLFLRALVQHCALGMGKV